MDRGSGRLYAVTTNLARIRGKVIGMAARAGAAIADAELVQFHPAAIAIGADPAPLTTEARRGKGAHLVNVEGLRFMTALHGGDISGTAFLPEQHQIRFPMAELLRCAITSGRNKTLNSGANFGGGRLRSR